MVTRIKGPTSSHLIFLAPSTSKLDYSQFITNRPTGLKNLALHCQPINMHPTHTTPQHASNTSYHHKQIKHLKKNINNKRKHCKIGFLNHLTSIAFLAFLFLLSATPSTFLPPFLLLPPPTLSSQSPPLFCFEFFLHTGLQTTRSFPRLFWGVKHITCTFSLFCGVNIISSPFPCSLWILIRELSRCYC